MAEKGRGEEEQSGSDKDSMGSNNGKVQPQDGEDEFDGPVSDRSCTDTAWLLIKALFVLGLLILVGRCIISGDIYRLVNGYDSCGNVCGRKNSPSSNQSPAFSCHGGDMTNKKYLLIKDLKGAFSPKNPNKECVENCNVYPNYTEFLNRCFPNNPPKEVNPIRTSKNKTTGKVKEKKITTENVVLDLGDFFHEVSEDLSLTWPKIVFLCLIALGLSIGTLILYRYFAAFVVWFILLGSIAISIGATVFIWVMYAKESKKGDERKANSYRDFGIVITIFSVVIVLIVLVMRKRIQLVIQLLKEASKATGAMPLLMIQPIYTFIALGITLTLWIYFTLMIQSSGVLTEGETKQATYLYFKKDMAMKISRWYNLFAMYWFVQFLIGCQHMVIAGSVASWFFTRDKNRLGSPILTSFKNLVRFHLGSVALGSLIIAFIQFIRMIFKMLEKSAKDSNNAWVKMAYSCIECLINCILNIVTYLTRNAYIEIAMFGTTFCEGGKQAMKLLINNSMSVAAINSVGDFVLALSKVLIVILTTFLAFLMFQNQEGLQHVWIPILIVALFSYFVAHCFITVYEMVIDTIFLCFCEDCVLNDGINKPYYMNKGLMEFVETSNRILKIGDRGSPKINSS